MKYAPEERLFITTPAVLRPYRTMMETKFFIWLNVSYVTDHLLVSLSARKSRLKGFSDYGRSCLECVVTLSFCKPFSGFRSHTFMFLIL